MIWFDLDNSPHVQLFKPIFLKLNERKIKYCVTARDFAQTKSLLKLHKIPHKLIGKHGGKSKIKKIINLIQRTIQLSKYIKNKNITLAVSHGSRTQVCSAAINNIPSIVMMDYEYTETRKFKFGGEKKN